MQSTKRYLQSTKNLEPIMRKIVEGIAPERFTVQHLEGLGFTSSNDRSVIGMLKDLGFLDEDGVPNERYHAYRDPSRSRAVMADAMREAYQDAFYISEHPTPDDREAIRGRFKTIHNISDPVADKMVATFMAFLNLADLEAADGEPAEEAEEEHVTGTEPEAGEQSPRVPSSRSLVPVPQGGVNLHYNIQIHLPATRDVEVYNAIFRSLRENVIG